MSAGPVRKRLQEALRKPSRELNFSLIQGWHSHPGFLAALVHAARLGLDRFGPDPAKPLVIFTAHSLPVRAVETGEPYDSQVRETAVFVADQLQLDREDYAVAYQSAGRSPEPWLGPVLRNTVIKAANDGRKNLLVVPVGFVTDNLELLYDIDVEARQAAEAHGAHLERCPALNDSPDFIAVLADLIQNNPPGV
jgi:ferrochelatase